MLPKLDVLFAELRDLDILALSETSLDDTVPSNDLHLQHYHLPERKDRIDRNGGGVMIYVHENLHYIRHRDLEPRGIECVWIELTLRQKRILFGLFDRAPESKAAYFNSIEYSIHLAVDTGIHDILIPGDFNFNMLRMFAANEKVFKLFF